MISYTDGEDAEYWLDKMKKPNHIALIQNEIMEQIRKLFPDKEIKDKRVSRSTRTVRFLQALDLITNTERVPALKAPDD